MATDIAVKRFGVNFSSIFNCCSTNHFEESSDHLFSYGQIASLVWAFFCNSCGIKVVQSQVIHRVMRWWLTKHKNEVHKTFLQCMPTIICWQIWKNRCSARFDGKKMSHGVIIHQVINMITMTIETKFPDVSLPTLWHDSCNRIEKVSPSTLTRISGGITLRERDLTHTDAMG